jgi:predicted nucleic acid-binding protein
LLYWDTSALLKLYVMEADSSQFTQLLLKSNQAIATSTIADTEILCAVYRKESAGGLKSGGAAAVLQKFQEDCRAGRIVRISYSEDVIIGARQIVRLAFGGQGPVMLRALDAIHLASAAVIDARAIVATDLRLREMALKIGLAILPPKST